MNQEALRSILRSDTCPVSTCRRPKDMHDPVCRRCHKKLTLEIKHGLYRTKDDGYGELVALAIQHVEGLDRQAELDKKAKAVRKANDG